MAKLTTKFVNNIKTTNEINTYWDETLKGFGLLFLLDGLSLYHCSDELKRKYSVKTSLFTYLKDTIKNGKLKHAPLYVPTDDDGVSTACYSDTKCDM